jgi:hypothetical protein
VNTYANTFGKPSHGSKTDSGKPPASLRVDTDNPLFGQVLMTLHICDAKVSHGSAKFVASVLKYATEKTYVTLKQFAALRDIAERADSLLADDGANLIDAHLPIFRILDELPGGFLTFKNGYRFRLLSDMSSTPGQIGVSVLNPQTHDRDFIGRIYRSGLVKLHKVADSFAVFPTWISKATKADILDIGTATKHCMVCNASLTNPESVLKGIGPICAKKVKIWNV